MGSRDGRRPDRGIAATVTRTSGSDTAWLSCWVDWNLDNVFAAATERIINSSVNVGNNDFVVVVPGTATVGTGSNTIVPARCRLYDSATEPLGPLVSDPGGAGVGGEVEDYNWGFNPTAITLQGIRVMTFAAAPLALALVVIFLVLGSAWGLRWREQ